MKLYPLTIPVCLVGGALATTACDQEGPTEPASRLPSISLRSASPRAAVIIRNGGCALFDGTGAIVVADRDLSILTQNTGQNTTLICKVKGVANPSGRAVKYDSEHNPFFPGLSCGTFAGVTTRWSETVSASGNATLHCHFKLGAGGSPPPDTMAARAITIVAR
jgi:hypothetical protein